MATPWIAITAYTPLYEQYAERLADSCHKHGVVLVKYKYQDAGNWKNNCVETVIIMLHALLTFKNDNIVWLDADAEVCGPLPFFDTCECDMAAQHIFTESTGTWHWNSGTIYFKNTRPVRQMLAMQYGILADDKVWAILSYMLEDLKWKEKLNVAELPHTYSAMVRRMGGRFNPNVVNPLIIQHQKSRVHKIS